LSDKAAQEYHKLASHNYSLHDIIFDVISYRTAVLTFVNKFKW